MLAFLKRLHNYLCRRPKEQACHNTRNDEIRPSRLRRPHAARRDHNGNVADRIVATAEPDRPDIRIAITVFHEQQDANEICQQSQKSDRAHNLRTWNL